jgi:hypothetical protein
MHELREDDADRRPRAFAVVHHDLPVRIVGRGDGKLSRTDGRRDGPELIERVPLAPPDTRANEIAGQQLHVPLLGTHEMLQRSVERSIRAPRSIVETSWIERPAKVQERCRRPGVVTQNVIERGAQVSLASRTAPSSIAYGHTCRSGGSIPCAESVVEICAR